MAVAFRNASNFNAGGATSCVLPVPTGTVNADAMIAVVVVGAASKTISTPAGWAALDSETTAPSIQTYRRIASSEPASYSFTWSGAAATAGIIASYSGADGTTPVNVHSAIHRATTTGTITGDAVITTVANTIILFVGAVNQTTVTFTDPAGYTRRQSAGGSGVSCFIADIAQAAAASTGTVTGSSSVSGTTDGTLIAIAPSAAAAASLIAPSRVARHPLLRR